jgi:hypothetical protein
MTYDHWKTTNPADQWLGPEPEDDGMSNEPRDIVEAQWQAFQRGAFTIWTIYDRPSDFPDGYIARRFEVGGGNTVATRDTVTGKLDDIRQAFWRAGLMKLTRRDGDEPQVVESWV